MDRASVSISMKMRLQSVVNSYLKATCWIGRRWFALLTPMRLSQALRQMLSQVPEAASLELDAFLGDCDARSYAPESQQQAVDAAFLERAIQLARGIAERAE